MTIPPAHLKAIAELNETGTRAFALRSIPPHARDHNDGSDLVRIVRYLSVETSARYKPAGGLTYCNIYATDYCYCFGVYLPRVWWNDLALADFILGKEVKPVYNKTVVELNANALHLWLVQFGERFGWRAATVEELQTAANSGKVPESRLLHSEQRD